jgi:ubiquinone/menaquinone biosynthesis C-methylase UbiE
MAAQYDNIANEYKQVPGLETRQVFEYSFQQWVGDVTGKSVLDLACGTGEFTRNYKKQGATKVVGVDISDEMIKVALQEEEQNPLGIEYIHRDVQQLGQIGQFDIVAASFLLHYLPAKEQLLEACRNIYANLLPGGRFITMNNNIQMPPECYNDRTYEKYGAFPRIVSEPLQEGGRIRWTMSVGDNQIQIENFYLSQETYEWALKTAGFKTIQLRDLALPPHLDKPGQREYWRYMLDHPCIIVIECRK